MNPKIKKRIEGLEIELKYCLYKQQGDKILEHWRIRELEIKEELKALRLKGRKVK